MSTTRPRAGAGRPQAAGVEITERATRFTLTFDAAPHSRRWHTHVARSATPSQAAEIVAALLDRGLREEREEPESHDPGMRAATGESNPAMGVALADATVDATNGIIRGLRYAPGWENAPLARLLAERTGAAIRLASATNAAAVAEVLLGAGRDGDPLLYVLIARSITSSLVVGGRYLAGASGEEGQLGHWLVRPDGPRCPCGAYGHLDPIASAQSLVRNLIGRAADSDGSTAAMLRVSGGRAEAMAAAQVVQLATEGDPAARAVLDDALDALAAALANLVAVLAPAAIVIGGPLASAGDGFFGPLRARLVALRGSITPTPALRPGLLGPLAPLLGACLLASDTATRQ
jgi:glucokinase